MALRNVKKNHIRFDFSQSENRKNNRKPFEGPSVELTKLTFGAGFDDVRQEIIFGPVRSNWLTVRCYRIRRYNILDSSAAGFAPSFP